MPAAPKTTRTARKPAQKAATRKPAGRKTSAESSDKKPPVKATTTKRAAKPRSTAKPAPKAPRKAPTAKTATTKRVTKPRSAAKAAPASNPETQKAHKAAKVVRNLMKSVKGDDTKISALFDELENLASYIKEVKKEIAALSPDEVKDEFLPTASDELDAIVEATADATNAIMDATEIVEEVMSGLDGKPSDELLRATTKIYEACTFQDITGQRITKVVSTLKEIEDKVDGLLNVFAGGKSDAAKKPQKRSKAKSKKEMTDEDLLNGPQSAAKAKSQAEIDALLASFD